MLGFNFEKKTDFEKNCELVEVSVASEVTNYRILPLSLDCLLANFNGRLFIFLQRASSRDILFKVMIHRNHLSEITEYKTDRESKNKITNTILNQYTHSMNIQSVNT